MKKIFLLAAMLSFLALNSCQDNTTPESGSENNTENSTDNGTGNDTDDDVSKGDGSYTIGERSGEITSAYYGIDEEHTCIVYLLLDGVEYSKRPPYKHLAFALEVPEQATELQTGTYKLSIYGNTVGVLLEGESRYGSGERYFMSGTLEVSKTGEHFTITASGILNDDSEVSATYTGRFNEIDGARGIVLGSGFYNAGDISGSLRYAYVWESKYNMDGDISLELHINSEYEIIDGEEENNTFVFDLHFPENATELQPGTYQLSDSIINRCYLDYYDNTGYHSNVYYEDLTLEISKEGTNYEIKVNGTLENGWEVSLEYSGYVTYDNGK